MTTKIKILGAYVDAAAIKVKVNGVYTTPLAMYVKEDGVYQSVNGFTGILDDFPNAAVAYSTRKLRANYAGPCIRVRRSSDSTEQDIGFSTVVDSSGNISLDTTAMLLFVAGGDGFVSIRYDQSGNGRHELQANPARQSRIVNAGVVTTIGGRPTLEFNGTSNWYQYTGEAYDSMTGVSCFSIAYLDSVASAGRCLHTISSGTLATSARFLSAANVGGGGRLSTAARRLDADGATQVNLGGVVIGFYQVTSLVDYTGGIVSISANNGVPVTTPLPSPGISSNTASLFTGTGATGGTGNFYTGYISETIAYKSTQAANVELINLNQMSAFAII